MPAEPTRLFVYGTLQPGRLRWPFLAPFALGHRPAGVTGRLYDSGHGWPAAVFDDAPTIVPGTLVELDPARCDEALVLLDEVEDTASDLFARIVVTTTDGATAWAYHCPSPEPGMVAIARWATTDER